ncbi:hypothetical protein LG331_09820 [Vreelandella aquamarina]|uniref:hypothetical protein n=1 Tax=Vreelandella aquamarina TaxID=77097 RepID=UPI00384D1ACA
MQIQPYYEDSRIINIWEGGSVIGFVIGAIVLAGIIGASLSNKRNLDRYQQLKNKRRFSGKRLTPSEQEEIDRLARKYWWW